MTPKEKQQKRMETFRKVKEKHPDALIMLRCGDFYELMEQDAEAGAKVLGITVTKHNDTGDKLAAFPYHALDMYLPRLIRSGYRVAICDGF